MTNRVIHKVPRDGAAADAALGDRRSMEIGYKTRLVRTSAGDITLTHWGTDIATYLRDGGIVLLDARMEYMGRLVPAWSRTTVSRLARLMPDDWTLHYRIGNRRPVLRYRGRSSPVSVSLPMKFSADGSVTTSYGNRLYEGTTPLSVIEDYDSMSRGEGEFVERTTPTHPGWPARPYTQGA
jgi:hypothetical protein